MDVRLRKTHSHRPYPKQKLTPLPPPKKPQKPNHLPHQKKKKTQQKKQNKKLNKKQPKNTITKTPTIYYCKQMFLLRNPEIKKEKLNDLFQEKRRAR